MHLHLPSGTVVTGTSAAMANAAFLSLATQASISLVNNKGNLGKTFKELGRSSTVKNLATAVITAGVADKIGATSALNNVSNTEWVNNLSVNLANAGSSAVIGTAINGGSLQDSLESAILSALVQTAHGAAASQIKDLNLDYVAHKIAHAVAGCAAAAANKGKCQDGAIGAAVGEIVSEELLNGRKVEDLSQQDYAQILTYSRLVAGTVAGLAGGDVNVAADAAKVAVENNSLSDPEIVAIGKRVDSECKGASAISCKNKIIAESIAKSDARSNLSQTTISAIVEVQNQAVADAMSICKGNSACATYVGNKFLAERLRCDSVTCMTERGQVVIRDTSIKYGSASDTINRLFQDFSPVMPTIKFTPMNFGSKNLLLSHYQKHGAEFGVKSAEEYLSLGRRVIQTGTRIKYSYKGEVRVGYVKFMENSSKGESKFAFVGTNNQGNITTIHVESGKNFWKTINSNTTEKVIYPR